MAILELNARAARRGDDGFLEAAEVDGGGVTDRRFHRRPGGRIPLTAELTHPGLNHQRAVAERGAVPAVSELRQHFEHVRQDILSDMGGDDPAVDEATRRLANRLLHYPSETLRKMAAKDPAAGRDAEEMVNRLFGLSGEESEKKE